MSKLKKGSKHRNKKGSLGMQSVIYGLDNKPEVTAADRIAKFVGKKNK